MKTSVNETSLAAATRPQIESLVRRVREDVLPVALASHSADEFDYAAAENLIAKSILSEHAPDLPVSDPLRTASFNLTLTDLGMRELVLHESDPARLVFGASRLAELGAYSLIDPDDPDRRPLQALRASKARGYFFTPPPVALEMAQEVVGARQRIECCLDPAAGAGALLGATALAAHARGTEIRLLRGYEIDPLTAGWCTKLLAKLRDLLGGSWQIEIENADAIDVLHQTNTYADALILNPPYGRVKFLRNVLTNGETCSNTIDRSIDEQDAYWKSKTADLAKRYAEISKQVGLGAGRQDFQRLFFGLALEALAPSGRLAIISPASWMGDADSLPLRRRLIENRLIESLHVYPEGTPLFATVNQVTAVAIISRKTARNSFQFDIRRNGKSEGGDRYPIEYQAIEKLDPDRLRLPKVDRQMHAVLEHLQAFPRIGDAVGVRNRRGEIDQSVNKSAMTNHPTDLRLLRGEHLERFLVQFPEDSDRPLYLDPDALPEAKRKRLADARAPRLVGRQVSYLNKPRRLSWATAGPGIALGNSCNFIAVDQAPDEMRDEDYRYALLGLLNSVVVEWYFRVNNTNNHVANYEIDELPHCLTSETVEPLATAARFLEAHYRRPRTDSRRGTPMEDVLDALVAHGFGLTSDQTHALVSEVEPERAGRTSAMVGHFEIAGVPPALTEGSGWYQHIENKLSGHDIEVVSYIPQGGNWTDIPESVPSKRLEQIREMTKKRGLVRTSYYGRLRPEQPSYTIATYYNRPGNGTNIPPWENRVLTSREAARLQSFPDWYVFASRESAVRKQIGNAVPPLLGFALGSQLRQVTDETCVDLFAGAGGLSLGLELAGFQVLAAADSDRRALDTYCMNRPWEGEPTPDSNATTVMEGDLSSSDHRRALAAAVRKKLQGRSLGLLVGGPPCQGFSHAGWRKSADERNDLAAAFLEAAEALDPSVVMLENVEGLLSYDKGRVVKDILLALKELGYDVGTSPHVLSAECYGVPQMRRRVFVVGTKTKQPFTPPAPIFQKCRGRREFTSSTPSLFEEDLPYPITAGEALYDLPRIGEVVHSSTGSRPIRPWFDAWARAAMSAEDFLEEARS